MSGMPGPIDASALRELLDDLRSYATDTNAVEAKRSSSAVPTDLWKVLSAFSNTNGLGEGLVLLGVDEQQGFKVTGVQDVALIQDQVQAQCNLLTPRPSPIVTPVRLDGRTAVVLQVPELSYEDKPCYHREHGQAKGAFVRSGDSNRALGQSELDAYVRNRRRSIDDEAFVPGTTVEDLDESLLHSFLDNLRATKPSVSGREDEEILADRGVIDEEGQLSLAALLAFGRDPSKYFPNLRVLFTQWYNDAGEPDEGGNRWHNSASLEGNLPSIWLQLRPLINAGLPSRAVVTGEGRHDVPQLPEVAVRELVVNALVHRSYAETDLSKPIDVGLYPDRLQVDNPGGLYQLNLDEQGIPDGHSTRNARLTRLLEDTPIPRLGGAKIVENRGSGIRTIIAESRRAHLRTPHFEDRLSSFSAVLPRQSLLDQETFDWLQQYDLSDLSEMQRIGAALLFEGDVLTNERYRDATGVDSRRATEDLAVLVQEGIAQPSGERGGRTYALHPRHAAQQRPIAAEVLRDAASRKAWLLRRVKHRGSVFQWEARDKFDVTQRTIARDVRPLIEDGVLVRRGARETFRYEAGPNFDKAGPSFDTTLF